MRTDVKLGVVLALVMVLAAGGYFMFRGEKQTPISLADAGKNASPDVKSQPGKPATPAKTGVGQPKPTTTPNRPAVKPPLNNTNTNAANRPAAPAGTNPSPTTNPALTNAPTEPKPALTGGPATSPPVTAPNTNPNLASNSGANRPGNPASPAITPVTSDPISPAGTTTSNPASTPTTGAPNGPAVVTNQPVTTSPSPNTGLTAVPNSASPPLSPAPARPVAMAPLTNSPNSPAPTSPSLSALPPGIKTPKTEPASAKPQGVDAAVETHKVQNGDSLSSLAQTYYGDTKYAKFLAESNPRLTDPNRLKVGTAVSIPPLPADIDSKMASTGSTPDKAAEKTSNGKRTYTVKAGDSFYSIAKSQLGNASRWKELLALNNSTVNGDPTSLQPGQRLVLPES